MKKLLVRFRLIVGLVLSAILVSSCVTTASHSQIACADHASSANSPIANFCFVDKAVLWRGAKPDVNGSAWLLVNGVRTIVNLELIYDDISSLTAARVSAATQYEVNYFRVRNWEPIAVIAPGLQDEQIAMFLAIMQASPKPVYVHCRAGQNRTGVNVAAYRILVEGMAIEEAISEMEKYGGLWFAADATYLRGIDASRRIAILANAKAFQADVAPHSVVRCKSGTCTAS